MVDPCFTVEKYFDLEGTSQVLLKVSILFNLKFQNWPFDSFDLFIFYYLVNNYYFYEI